MKSPRGLVSCAVRIYAAALFLYPRALRARYGRDMLRTFEDRCDAARSLLAIVALLSRELIDIVTTSIRPRADTWVGPYTTSVGEDPRVRPEWFPSA